MNALKRWNQLRELEALQHGLSSVFGRSSIHSAEGQEEQIAVPEWAPLVDISEDEKEYLIKAELPDVKREDVKVTAEEGTLTITGERRFEKEEKGKKYHRVERCYGSFVRNFSLPDDASPAKVSAPNSKTACSPCIWPKQQNQHRSKLRLRLPEQACSRSARATGTGQNIQCIREGPTKWSSHPHPTYT